MAKREMSMSLAMRSCGEEPISFRFRDKTVLFHSAHLGLLGKGEHLVGELRNVYSKADVEGRGDAGPLCSRAVPWDGGSWAVV